MIIELPSQRTCPEFEMTTMAKSGDLCWLCWKHAWTSAQPHLSRLTQILVVFAQRRKNLSGNHGLKLSTKLSRKTVYLMRPNGYWCQAATWLSNQFTFSGLESGLAWQLCTSCLRLSSPFVSKWLKSADLFLSLPDVQRLQSFIHMSKSKSESKSCDVLICSLRASKKPPGWSSFWTPVKTCEDQGSQWTLCKRWQGHARSMNYMILKVGNPYLYLKNVMYVVYQLDLFTFTATPRSSTMVCCWQGLVPRSSHKTLGSIVAELLTG